MAWFANGTSLDGSSGLGVASVELGTASVDTVVIESVEDWGDNHFDFGDWVTVRQNSDVVLYGMVTAVEPFARAGAGQGRRYTISGPWWHLERTVYKQLFWYATGFAGRTQHWRSKVWLGTNSAGERVPTNVQIADILAYASGTAGIGFGYSISGFGVLAPVAEVADQTCAALIMQLLRWHPNVQVFWTYAPGSATLNFRTMSALAEASIDVSDADASDPAPVQCHVHERADQVPPCVVVKYERVNQFDDGDGAVSTLIEYGEDKAGSGSEHSPGALVYTIELQGSRSTAMVQPIRTRSVPPTDTLNLACAKWYQAHVAGLKALDPEEIEVVGHAIILDEDPTGDGPDPEDSAPPPPGGDPEDYPRELVEGTIQEWMSGVKATPMIARGKLRFTGTPPTDPVTLENAKKVFGDSLSAEAVFYVRYMGTDATTRRYSALASFTEAESWPLGLADAVLSNLSTARHEGTVTIKGQSCPVNVKPGMMLTLTGRGATGPVQQVSYDANAAVAVIRLGWPGHLSPQDIFERMRASRMNAATASYSPERRADAKMGGKESAVPGALRGPIHDVQPVVASMGTHPFFVSANGEGYAVEPGTWMSTEVATGMSGDLEEGTQLVYLKLEYTLLTSEDYVYGATWDASSIVVVDEPIESPQGPNDTGVFHILLARFEDRAKTAQLVTTSLQGHVTDDGSATGKGILICGAIAYVPAEEGSEG